MANLQRDFKNSKRDEPNQMVHTNGTTLMYVYCLAKQSPSPAATPNRYTHTHTGREIE